MIQKDCKQAMRFKSKQMEMIYTLAARIAIVLYSSNSGRVWFHRGKKCIEANKAVMKPPVYEMVIPKYLFK